MGSCLWNFILGCESVGMNTAERTVSLTTAGWAGEIVSLVTGSKEHQDVVLAAISAVAHHPILVRRA